MTIEYVPAGVARLLGVGGRGVGLVVGVLVVAGEPPPHASRDSRTTTRTTTRTTRVIRLSFLPVALLRMSRNSTIPGKSKHNAYSVGCPNGEGRREAFAAVVLTVTWIGGTPDEVAMAVGGEKEQAAPMGKLAHENEKVWLRAALTGAKARANEAV
jgi:hypothetical protein